MPLRGLGRRGVVKEGLSKEGAGWTSGGGGPPGGRCTRKGPAQSEPGMKTNKRQRPGKERGPLGRWQPRRV